MKKIVVGGMLSASVKNLGDDAMLRSLLAGLNKNEGFDVVFLTRHPASNIEKDFSVRTIRNFDYQTRAPSVGKWFNGLNPGDDGKNLKEIREEIASCDLLLIGAGPIFLGLAKGLYRGPSADATLLATIAKFFQKPYMMIALEITQPPDPLTLEQMKFCVENSFQTTVREKYSKNLLDELKIKTTNVFPFCDPAFGIVLKNNFKMANSVLDSNGIKLNKEKQTIILTVREQYWKRDEIDIVTKNIARFCDYLCNKFNFNLLFVPQCFYTIDNDTALEDRLFHQKVISQMKNRDYTYAIQTELTLDQLLSIYCVADAAICNRRHSAIFALLNAIPVVTFGRASHFVPYLDEGFELGSYHVNVKEDFFNQLKSKFESMWSKKSELSSKIQADLLVLRKLAAGHNECIRGFFDN